jgi:hypothetical protein
VPFSHEPGTQIVQWSPTHELQRTDETIMRNMQAMQSA